ncbi:MAG: leucyl aminopeptidase family protein [Pseudomonadota bacterium]|nr:leucyl aminopeptidase family protein [Pseudomonadota bacterium]
MQYYNDQDIAAAGFVTNSDAATHLTLLTAEQLEQRLKDISAVDQAWIKRQGFSAKPGEVAFLQSGDALVGWDGNDNVASLGHLPMRLPEGDYQLSHPISNLQAVGWGLGAYQFDRYKDVKRAPARLVVTANLSLDDIMHKVAATQLTRDLINTPSQDMAPSHLEAETHALAKRFGAALTVSVGEELLDRDCGAIHAVGRAATDAPRLMDLTWGDEQHPRITVIGKGVTFDSGGLNIKPGAGMRLMKKDMGGAAIAMGLSYLIMAQNLPVRLRLLLPAAENAIAGNAFRPGDILHTHKGLTVEIDNTDAEGRLLLCDALSIASEDEPQLIIDYATLTGAARVAVGTEIAAMFCNDKALANQISASGDLVDDAVWPLPLHNGYNHMLSSKVADLVNSAASGFAGASTAALFLQRFINDKTPWLHFDVMAFNTRSRPGRPEGGEAMALRAVYHYLEKTYGHT